MKVIILAANAQKAAIADKLIESEDFSKVLLTPTSKKLVEEGQAVIVYFESREDLNRLENLLKVYTGVPLKYYVGDKAHRKFEHFSPFTHAQNVSKSLTKLYRQLGKSADVIYETVFQHGDSEKELTVDTLLGDIKARDVIEEPCMQLFSQEKHQHGQKKEQKQAKKKIEAKDVKVSKDKFRQWWTQSKQDNFEFIKYYLIGWMAKQIKEKGIDEKTIKKIRDFRGYQMRRKQIRILKDHYDNNFSLKINGQRSTTVTTVDASKVTATHNKGGLKEEIKTSVDVSQPSEDSTGHSDKAGTVLDLQVTFFPDEKMETMNNLQNLHQFSSDDTWISIGLNPKQKDLKTFVEDLMQFEYFETLKEEDYESSIILDGKNVRLGVKHSDKLDLDALFTENEQYTLYYLQMIGAQDEKEEEQEAKFQFNIQLGKRLIDILKSDEPLLVNLLEQASVDASLKFHLKQFRSAYENLEFDQDYKEYIEPPQQKPKKEKENEENNNELDLEAMDNNEKPVLNDEELKDELDDFLDKTKDDKFKVDKDEEDQDGDDDDEDDDDDDDDDDDNQDDEDGEDGAPDDEEDDEDEDEEDAEEEEEENKDEFDMQEFLKDIIPMFLFKWNAKIKMQPDLDEFVEYCKQHKDQSKFLKPFSEAFIAESQDQGGDFILRGSKSELIDYLINEIGFEVDIAWKTSYFFLSAKLKTQELGGILSMLSKSGIIQ